MRLRDAERHDVVARGFGFTIFGHGWPRVTMVGNLWPVCMLGAEGNCALALGVRTGVFLLWKTS
jgi:hypothetical protein